MATFALRYLAQDKPKKSATRISSGVVQGCVPQKGSEIQQDQSHLPLATSGKPQRDTRNKVIGHRSHSRGSPPCFLSRSDSSDPTWISGSERTAISWPLIGVGLLPNQDSTGSAAHFRTGARAARAVQKTRSSRRNECSWGSDRFFSPYRAYRHALSIREGEGMVA